MKPTVLTIDDEPDIVELVQSLLEREGYRVLAAHNAAQALEILAQERPDLILCDVLMSGMGGFRLLRHLKANPQTADIPVILVSALSGTTTISDGWYAGADMYLTKPFKTAEILSVVRRFVDPQAASALLPVQTESN